MGKSNIHEVKTALLVFQSRQTDDLRCIFKMDSIKMAPFPTPDESVFLKCIYNSLRRTPPFFQRYQMPYFNKRSAPFPVGVFTLQL